MTAPQHGEAMAKPRKVEEPAGTYSARKKRAGKSAPAPVPAAKSGVRYLDPETASHIADKIFSERKDLLHKLAQ